MYGLHIMTEKKDLNAISLAFMFSTLKSNTYYLFSTYTNLGAKVPQVIPGLLLIQITILSFYKNIIK